jgi:hypothetical protein
LTKFEEAGSKFECRFEGGEKGCVAIFSLGLQFLW